jgi:PII-like signaling protein
VTAAIDITVARIYLTEREAHLDRLVEHLRLEEKVTGLTVFRAVAGFGPSGHVHSAHLVDLAADLPLVVEFFDTPERIEAILAQLRTWLPPGPIVTWPARLDQPVKSEDPDRDA